MAGPETNSGPQRVGAGSGGFNQRKQQINLPWLKAVEIAMNSLKIRFWRSVITASGIFLSIAFLCYSLVNLWLPPPADSPAQQLQEHYQQIWLVWMSLLVCVVGIMNAMLMSVSERFREIGTMKCLGALDSLIVRLFMIEAIFMGIVASFIGWGIGLLAVDIVRLLTLKAGLTGIDPAMIAKLFGCCMGAGAGLTAVAALLPAVRAAQMPPAAALRTEV
jgi:putative ABC transport system permease protein